MAGFFKYWLPTPSLPTTTKSRAAPIKSKAVALLHTVPSNLCRRVDAELTPCLFRAGPPLLERLHHPTTWSDVMFWFALFAAMIHYCCSTIVFSPLFIDAADGVAALAIYAASAVFCRIVLLSKLDCIKLQDDYVKVCNLVVVCLLGGNPTSFFSPAELYMRAFCLVSPWLSTTNPDPSKAAAGCVKCMHRVYQEARHTWSSGCFEDARFTQ